MKVFLVTAYLFGRHDKQSYPVSIRSSLQDALNDAGSEEKLRGSNYCCEVLEWELDRYCDLVAYEAKVIKPLPDRTCKDSLQVKAGESA